MSVTVPSGDVSNSLKLQTEITALSSRGDAYSQQRLKQQQEALVHTLLDQGKLNAATILSTVTYNSSNALTAQISALQTKITAFNAVGGSQAAIANGLSAHELPSMQRQLVGELMASGQMPAASILSNGSLAYVGAPTSR